MNPVATKIETNTPHYLNLGWKDREYEETVEDIWGLEDNKLKDLLQDILQDQLSGTPAVVVKVKNFTKVIFLHDVCRFFVSYEKSEPQRPERPAIPGEATISFM